MTEERRLTIASSSRVHPEDVARHTFATGRRGFDPAEVRAYLEEVARELHAAMARERELRDAVAEAQRRAANPVLDEATLTTALGQETAKVLRTAHDAASELVARAESDAGRVQAQAQDEAEQLRARAEEHATERAQKADAAAAEVHRQAQEEAAGRVETAKLEAEAMVSQARAECRAMVQEAQDLRARVLSDLTRRRRLLHTQIEQLRAGRERLAETITEVRHTVDRVTDDLMRAEDEARSAAEAAGRQADRDELDDVTSDQGAATTTAATPPLVRIGEVEPEPGLLSEEPPPGASESAPPEERRQQAVEELFARLRAEQGPARAADEGIRLLGPVPPEPTAASEPGVSALPAAAAGEEEPDKEPDPVLARRDELLGPIVAALARRLKRALADDQNAILDRLRGERAWSDEVLGSEEDQQKRYVEAAGAQLEEAGRAGAAFAGDGLQGAPAVGAEAEELSRAVVAPLRRHLMEKSTGLEAGDEAAMSDHVGSAFREWKGQRVERLAADHAHHVFWQAALSTWDGGAKLRWLVDDDGVHCPDCDDNALAGPLPRGEAFPTGHAYPPAHSGCRCLLVPDTA